MKHWLLHSFLLTVFIANAQTDTLLFEDFEIDPSSEMLPYPNGNDTVWVNFDEDGEATYKPDVVPQNWYSEYGQFDSPTGEKTNVFTSISYLKNTDKYNHNWLILPPIKICGNNASVHWKSAPLIGPAFMDGYYLLISKSGNDVNDFVDTLFGAAECTVYPATNSTDPADFQFSPGYIHANTFTDSAYFEYSFPTNHCKLEPHSYFLGDFANQTVYLAFLHNSRDDLRLDLDDILVLGNKCASAIDETGDFDLPPVLYPNPVDFKLDVIFSLKKAGNCRFTVVDELGGPVFYEEKKGFKAGPNEWYFWPKTLPAGQYFLKIETQNGSVSRPFSKI